MLKLTPMGLEFVPWRDVLCLLMLKRPRTAMPWTNNLKNLALNHDPRGTQVHFASYFASYFAVRAGHHGARFARPNASARNYQLG